MYKLIRKRDFLFILAFIFAGFFLGKLVANSKIDSAPTIRTEPAPPLSTRRADPFNRSSSLSGERKGSLNKTFLSGNQNEKLAAILAKLLAGEIPQNWEDELQKILHYTKHGNSTESLLILFSKWAEVDFQKALERAGKIPNQSFVLKREIFAQLAKKDPEMAFMFYEKNKELLNTNSGTILGYIAKNMAMQNPDKTLNWCFAFDGTEKNIALKYFMRGIGYKSEKTREYIEKIYHDRGALPSGLIADWAEADPDSALEWGKLNENSSPHYTESVIRGLVIGNDLKRATDLLLSIPEEERLRSMRFLSLHIQDPEESLSFHLKVVPSSKIDAYYFQAMPSWAAKHPEDAERWINDLPTSPVKDLAINLYAEGVSEEQPYGSVLDLVESMEDAPKKESTINTLIQKWQKENPEQLNDWLKQSENSKWRDLATEKLQKK